MKAGEEVCEQGYSRHSCAYLSRKKEPTFEFMNTAGSPMYKPAFIKLLPADWNPHMQLQDGTNVQSTNVVQ